MGKDPLAFADEGASSVGAFLMKGRVRWPSLKEFAVWLAIFTGAGCVSQGILNPRAGQSQLWVLEGMPTSERAALAASSLSLPESGELRIYPKWFVASPWIREDGTSLGEESSYCRLQFLLRLIRRDGGVMQWFPIAHQIAPPGEGGHQLDCNVRHRGAVIALEPARYGPFRVNQVAAIEVAVVFLPSPEGNPLLFVGGAALTRASGVKEAGSTVVPPPASGKISEDEHKGHLVVSARIPVHGEEATSYEGVVQRLLLETPTHTGTERLSEHVRTTFTSLPADTSFSDEELLGQLKPGMHVLVVDLNVNIPRHSQ